MVDEAPPVVKPTFEEAHPEISRIVQSRRGAWVHVSLMEWNDVAAILTARIWKKWHTFDPTRGRLENWCNTLISNEFKNLRRDLRGRWERPCVGGGKANGSRCVHNLGANVCEVTPSKNQCAECPLYAEWEKTRQHQFHIKSTVALEHHAQEVSNIQGDFNDIEGIKTKLDEAMKRELTAWEWRVYQCVYVHHMTPTQASTHLEALVKTWKRAPRVEEQPGYQAVLQLSRRIKAMMLDQLKRDGHL